MRVSASEAGRVPLMCNVKNAKNGKDNINFKKILSDSLPDSIKPCESEIAFVKKAIDKSADIREDVVVSLSEQIANGNYDVSSNMIVDMMIRRKRADKVR